LGKGLPRPPGDHRIGFKSLYPLEAPEQLHRRNAVITTNINRAASRSEQVWNMDEFRLDRPADSLDRHQAREFDASRKPPQHAAKHGLKKHKSRAGLE
jgi:hypothetical protein